MAVFRPTSNNWGIKWSWPQLNFSPVAAVDFGSEQLRIWFGGTVVVDEPSLVAVENRTQRIVGVGVAAAEMRERLSRKVQVVAPIVGGKLIQPDLAFELLRVALSRALKGQFFSPTLVVSLHTLSHPEMITAYTQLLYRLGAKEVIGVAEPLAAAIGAGVPVADVSGGLVAVLGGTVVEAGVVALGSLVQTVSRAEADQQLIQALIQQILSTHDLVIGRETALELLLKLARVNSLNSTRTLWVTGKSARSGAPKEVAIHPVDLTPALQLWVQGVEQMLAQLLREIPPELITDVTTKGVLLAGGMAKLEGLEDYLAKKLNLPVAAVENPSSVVIQGLATICENLDQYKQSLAYEVRE
ncbi:MAG TPA: hypothetical protein DEP87_00410 [Candidatus Pacebacteria bacterium]|nr:hypothetical protein [Candidatus Paceibacterota bacterium]